MQRVKALDEVTLADLWREGPVAQDEFWQDTRQRQGQILKVILEGALEEEITALLGAGRFRRTDERCGHRNGFYSRDLVTQIGVVTAIRVPRARGGVVERAAFSRYQRRQGHVNQVIREVFLAGVSTRRVGETLTPSPGLPVSALGERRSPGGVSQPAAGKGFLRPLAQARRDGRLQRAARRSRRCLPVCAPAALLGAQAEERRQPPQEAPAGGVSGWGKTHLSGPDETGGCTRLLVMGKALASGGFQSCGLPGTRSRSAPGLSLPAPHHTKRK